MFPKRFPLSTFSAKGCAEFSVISSTSSGACAKLAKLGAVGAVDVFTNLTKRRLDEIGKVRILAN